jgi:hypothetical protein
LVLGAVRFKIGGMQPAIQSIVDVYVRYGNRRALDNLWVHREKLLAGLKPIIGGPYDLTKPIADEIAIIESGLAKLNGLSLP